MGTLVHTFSSHAQLTLQPNLQPNLTNSKSTDTCLASFLLWWRQQSLAPRATVINASLASIQTIAKRPSPLVYRPARPPVTPLRPASPTAPRPSAPNYLIPASGRGSHRVSAFRYGEPKDTFTTD